MRPLLPLLPALIVLVGGCGDGPTDAQQAAFAAARTRCEQGLAMLEDPSTWTRGATEVVAGIEAMSELPQHLPFEKTPRGIPKILNLTISEWDLRLADAVAEIRRRHVADPDRHDEVAALLAAVAPRLDVTAAWGKQKAAHAAQRAATAEREAREARIAAIVADPDLLTGAIVVRYESPFVGTGEDFLGLKGCKRSLEAAVATALEAEVGDVPIYRGSELPADLDAEAGAELVINLAIEGAEYRGHSHMGRSFGERGVVKVPEVVSIALIGSTSHFAHGLIFDAREEAPEEIADQGALARIAEERFARFFAEIEAELAAKELLDDPEGLAAALAQNDAVE